MSTISTSLPSCLARSSAQRAMSTGSRFGALLVDGRARLAADLDELVDRRRAVDVARGDGDRRAVLLALQVAGELGGRGRLARALQAGHEDRRSAAAARTSSPPRRRP